MSEGRPTVLTIAGFDPSGGAGILADVKTFEAHKVYGLAVCTSVTFQNDLEFDGLRWMETEEIIRQIEVLARRIDFSYAKVGLIKNLECLSEILKTLKGLKKDITIIWDPILKASAGFEFHKEMPREQLTDICKSLSLVTPNRKEILTLAPGKTAEEGAALLSAYCPVLLKGGHSASGDATDILYSNNKQYHFTGQRTGNDKHGTGCVLSASLLSLLALGNTLTEACEKAKSYTRKFIDSDQSLLGNHYA